MRRLRVRQAVLAPDIWRLQRSFPQSIAATDILRHQHPAPPTSCATNILRQRRAALYNARNEPTTRRGHETYCANEHSTRAISTIDNGPRHLPRASKMLSGRWLALEIQYYRFHSPPPPPPPPPPGFNPLSSSRCANSRIRLSNATG